MKILDLGLRVGMKYEVDFVVCVVVIDGPELELPGGLEIKDIRYNTIIKGCSKDRSSSLTRNSVRPPLGNKTYRLIAQKVHGISPSFFVFLTHFITHAPGP